MSLVYLETSVALAALFGETRQPTPSLWEESLVSSWLLSYELHTRLNARRLPRRHHDVADRFTQRITLVPMGERQLARATEPSPTPVRALDALHLATAAWLRGVGAELVVATYDARFAEAATAMGMELHPVERP